jgi:hypothetical protein
VPTETLLADLGILESRVLAGEPDALDLALRAYFNADGLLA